ncbi:maleylpyruvate isomerase N-terminal domain-containing protein [Saccharopolyspora rhizosphaerae]|uniref:maleylpyruvate isomerase N-terminal domain-containing protein n=1 Tax=Saccharopolyspora rhizosphaerae TaxID=2492662 RepID=UPI001F323948|nr:maleylpyruvate isomerase N-terminal domain-containing protein [Saccharopolyspora rhizosphaerae]
MTAQWRDAVSGAAPVMGMAVAERADLAEHLATLTPEQWGAPSLCAGSRVRDVVAHMTSYDGMTWAGVLKRGASGVQAGSHQRPRRGGGA